MSCHRRCFEDYIKEYNEKYITDLDEKHPSLREKSILEPHGKLKTEGKYHICKYCSSQLQNGHLPTLSVMNGLEIVKLTDSNGENIKLTDLEAALVAKTVLFMKIYQLPRSRWSALKDRTICVPLRNEAISETVKSFPRSSYQAGVITVEWKRKKAYKNYHIRQRIRVNALIEALSTLALPA